MKPNERLWRSEIKRTVTMFTNLLEAAESPGASSQVTFTLLLCYRNLQRPELLCIAVKFPFSEI